MVESDAVSVSMCFQVMAMMSSMSRDVAKLPLRFQRRPFPSEAIDSSFQQTRWLVTGGEM